jgi:hypothetical protein
MVCSMKQVRLGRASCMSLHSHGTRVHGVRGHQLCNDLRHIWIEIYTKLDEDANKDNDERSSRAKCLEERLDT